MKKTTWIWLAIAVAAIILIWYFFIRETEVEKTAKEMRRAAETNPLINAEARRMGMVGVATLGEDKKGPFIKGSCGDGYKWENGWCVPA